MEHRKYVAYNQTRDTLLSSSVTTVNAGLEPLKVLKVLIEGLPANSRTGLWLTNFKGVPVARTLSPFDLVYLDKDNRVVQGVELSKDGEFSPPRGQPSSALVLPPKSLTASATKSGDQLELRVAEPEAQDASQPSAPSVSPEQVATAQVPQTSTTSAAPAQAKIPPAPPIPPPVQPGGYRPEASSPSARFFSPGEIAVPKSAPQNLPEQSSDQASSADARETGSSTSPAQRSRGGASWISGIDNAARPTTEPLPENFIRSREPAPFWPESATRDPALSAPTPLASPEPATPTDTPLKMAETLASSAPAQAPATAIPRYPNYGPVVKPKYPWKVRLLRWLFPELVIKESPRPVDRRRADRQELPGLAAYYFTGGSPEPQKIANISVTGFYLHTDERWMPGTIVRMTLQRIGSKGDDPSDTISVNSKIVRWGTDGEGFEFILTDLEE